jgi:hypothetical protein
VHLVVLSAKMYEEVSCVGKGNYGVVVMARHRQSARCTSPAGQCCRQWQGARDGATRAGGVSAPRGYLMPQAHGGAAPQHPCVAAPDGVAAGHQELRLALAAHVVGGIRVLLQRNIGLSLTK